MIWSFAGLHVFDLTGWPHLENQLFVFSMAGNATASFLTRKASNGSTCVLNNHFPAFDPWQNLTCILFPSFGSEVTTLDLWPQCDLWLTTPTPQLVWLFCTICSPPGSRRALPFVPTSCCHLCSLSLGVLKSTAPNNGLSPPSCLVCWLWLNANNDYYECPFSEMLIMLLHSSPYLAFENPGRRISFIPSLWRAGNWGLATLNVICLNSHQVLGPVIFPPNLFPMLPIY